VILRRSVVVGKNGGWEPHRGVRSSSCWGWQPLRPSHHVLEEKALQQRGRRRLVDSVMSRCALRSNPPFGAPGKPPLAAQQVAVGQHFARQILRVHPDERIFGKRADIGPEYEGALAVAGRQRPRVVRRRQTGILDIGDFRRRNEVDRRPMASRIRANAAATRTSGRGRGWRARRRAGTCSMGFPSLLRRRCPPHVDLHSHSIRRRKTGEEM